MVAHCETLNLSIGDEISNARLASKTCASVIELHGKQVFVDLSADAVTAVSDSLMPIACQVELYFSCMVRKQLHFREIHGLSPGDKDYSRVIPGFFVGFRALTTQQCSIRGAGDSPSIETMPIHKPERFVPDWIKIDYRAGQWLGEYGFKRSL